MQEMNRDLSCPSVDHGERRPPTLIVLALMIVAALLFSYIGAYNVSVTLVNADLIAPWPAGSDPRPKWMVTSFLTVILTFTVVGTLMRFASCRSLRDLDRLADDE